MAQDRTRQAKAKEKAQRRAQQRLVKAWRQDANAYRKAAECLTR